MVYYCANLEEFKSVYHRSGSIVDWSCLLSGGAYVAIKTSSPSLVTLVLREEFMSRRMAGLNLLVPRYTPSTRHATKFIENYSDCNLMSIFYPGTNW